jgi:hypothetical protein
MSPSAKFWIPTVISLLALGGSLYSYSLSRQANFLAEEANSIAKESVNVEKDGNSIVRTENSYAKVDQALREAHSGINQQVMDKIQNKQAVQVMANLYSLVDVFEGLGDDYCQGLIYRNHMYAKFMSDFYYVCSSNQINKELAGKKNGLAIICAEFQPRSIFAKTIEEKNIPGCNFRGSERFN